jgi:hypothetical protein
MQNWPLRTWLSSYRVCLVPSDFFRWQAVWLTIVRLRVRAYFMLLLFTTTTYENQLHTAKTKSSDLLPHVRSWYVRSIEKIDDYLL